MEKMHKPVLKKAGTSGEKTQKKVHFPPNMTERSISHRKRQSKTVRTEKKKKFEACKTLPKVDDLILSKESRVALLEQKVDQTAANVCKHYFNTIETVVTLANTKNKLDIFEKELDDAQEYMDRCVDEVDMSMINRMYEESLAADNLWAEFLKNLEHTIEVLENDDVNQLPIEADNIQRLLEQMILTGQ